MINGQPWEIIISEINRILRELHITLSEAFSNRSSQMGTAINHEHLLFEAVWQQLNFQEAHSEQAFVNLPLQKNAEQIIFEYCRDANLSREIITQPTQSLLEHIIEIHQHLAKQRALLLLFNDDDEMGLPLTSRMVEFKMKCNELHEQVMLFSTKKNEIENELAFLEGLLAEIARIFVQKGYYEATTFPSLSKLTKQDEMGLESIRQLLTHLPTMASIKERILQAAPANSDNHDLQNIAQTYTILNQLISSHIQINNDTITHLTQKHANNQSIISDLNDYAHLQELFKAIAQLEFLSDSSSKNELYDITTDTLAICQHQVGLSLLNKLKSNTWVIVIEKLNIVTHIANKFDQLIQPYFNHLDDMQDLLLRLETNIRKINQHSINQKKIIDRFIKINSTWDNYRQTLAEIQNQLSQSSESNIDYLKSFLKHHGLKMLIGGASGASFGTLIAFATAVNPLSFFVLSLGGLTTGTSIGAGTGLGIDNNFFSKSFYTSLIKNKHGDEQHDETIRFSP